MKDLDEELLLLGYGCPWDAQVDRLMDSHVADLERLRVYDKENHEKKLKAMRAWRERRKQETEALVGLARCACGVALTHKDLIRNYLVCGKCRGK